MLEEVSLRFKPSAVKGLFDVTEVVVHPDRLELLSTKQWVTFQFIDMVVWPYPQCIWRKLFKIGWKPRWLPVGERDWFHPPSKRFFCFYTQPNITIYMPDEPTEMEYEQTLFRKVQDTMLAGGFNTWDLG